MTQTIDLKNSKFAYSTVALLMAAAVYGTIQWINLEDRVGDLEKSKLEMYETIQSSVVSIDSSLSVIAGEHSPVR